MSENLDDPAQFLWRQRVFPVIWKVNIKTSLSLFMNCWVVHLSNAAENNITREV